MVSAKLSGPIQCDFHTVMQGIECCYICYMPKSPARASFWKEAELQISILSIIAYQNSQV